MLMYDFDLRGLILSLRNISDLNRFFFLVFSWRMMYDLPEAEGPAMIIASLLRSSFMLLYPAETEELHQVESMLLC